MPALPRASSSPLLELHSLRQLWPPEELQVLLLQQSWLCACQELRQRSTRHTQPQAASRSACNPRSPTEVEDVLLRTPGLLAGNKDIAGPLLGTRVHQNTGPQAAADCEVISVGGNHGRS